MRPAAGYVISGDYSSNNGGGSGNIVINCQDCGNKPKKDCVHMRCRTCCRSRGLPCKTHIKSTWIPAAKRRQRQQLDDFSKQPHNFMRNGVGCDQNRKRPRDDHEHHITPPGFHFPAELSSPAIFWCVRVNGTDETEEQLAYMTTVSIGGHVFNGILYDQGPNDHNQHNNPVRETSSITGSQYQQVNLITPATTTTTIINPDFTIIDPSSMYPTPLSTYLGYDFTDYGLITK